jgi:hypothetical protein
LEGTVQAFLDFIIGVAPNRLGGALVYPEVLSPSILILSLLAHCMPRSKDLNVFLGSRRYKNLSFSALRRKGIKKDADEGRKGKEREGKERKGKERKGKERV